LKGAADQLNDDDLIKARRSARDFKPTPEGLFQHFSAIVQRHATWTPDRRPILTPLSREPISC